MLPSNSLDGSTPAIGRALVSGGLPSYAAVTAGIGGTDSSSQATPNTRLIATIAPKSLAILLQPDNDLPN